MGRADDPAEIAEAIAFLASPSSSYITGVALPSPGHLIRAVGRSQPVLQFRLRPSGPSNSEE
jgi:NAD(P)-dependent dehydrogenase (short-subunit alcohol dehydrogenase family)